MEIFNYLLGQRGEPDLSNKEYNEDVFFVHGLRVVRIGYFYDVFDTFNGTPKLEDAKYKKIKNIWLLEMIRDELKK